MRVRLLIATVVVLLTAAASAGASTTRACVPGDGSSPTCRWWKAKVLSVSDGDTIEVRSAGREQSVRFVGINAMELSRYSHRASLRRGQCMGVPAANFVQRMIRASRWRVRLAAQSSASHSGPRLRRSVWVRSGGRWVDLARAELAAGYALFLPNGDEDAHNRDYQVTAAEARAAGRNLWDTTACGVGPDAEVPLSISVNWDADGADEANLNGEWIELRNNGQTNVDLGGWWARDSWLNWDGGKRHGTPGYRFADGTILPAGGRLRLHVGCGDNTATDAYWCQRSSAFENVSDDAGIGDGAYLFDPRGNLRTSFMYPCQVSCVDPLAGKVQLLPLPTKDAVAILNPTFEPIDLNDHVLKLRRSGNAGQYVYGHVFPPFSYVPPLGYITFTSAIGSGLSDNGGVVELRTLDDQLTTCEASGFGRC